MDSSARRRRPRRDFIAFDVAALGETRGTSRSRGAGRAISISRCSTPRARRSGYSFWEQPEHVRLTYLPIGRYYARVTEFSQTADGHRDRLHADRRRGPRAPDARPRRTARPSTATRSSAGTARPARACRSRATGRSPRAARATASGLRAAGSRVPELLLRRGCRYTRDVCARDCSSDTRLRAARHRLRVHDVSHARTSASRSAPRTRNARPRSTRSPASGTLGRLTLRCRHAVAACPDRAAPLR